MYSAPSGVEYCTHSPACAITASPARTSRVASRVVTRSIPPSTTVYSSNAGVWPGSTQPGGLVMRAIDTAAVRDRTRPMYSSIRLGLLPAASMIVGPGMCVGIARSLVRSRPAILPAMPDPAPWTGPLPRLPGGWHEVLGPHLESSWFRQLWGFVQAERAGGPVFPPEAEVFAAFEHAPYDRVKLVLIGQDPYHDDGQAHGLCFSVREGVPPPPSLKNMFKELEADLGIAPPRHGCLDGWARQGALLLNAVLTVRAHEPNSHKSRGWEKFTDLVID